jgi:hypothetical protein
MRFKYERMGTGISAYFCCVFFSTKKISPPLFSFKNLRLLSKSVSKHWHRVLPVKVNNSMAQSKQKPASTDGDLHKGYNEKNPVQPQGAFSAESNGKSDDESRKKTSVQQLEKRKANLINKK